MGMIRFYFSIQCRRFYRIAQTNRLPIGIGLGLMLALFSVLSYAFFLKVPYASWFYLMGIVLGIISLSKRQRITHLNQIFPKQTMWLIRCIEHLILATPFIIVLMLYNAYFEIVLALCMAGLGAFYVQRRSLNISLPTPFKKYPFEFIIGFRKLWPFYLLGLVITVMGIRADNYNLTMVTLLIPFLIGLQFYNLPEPLPYVWVHSFEPTHFLRHKIKIAMVQSLILGAPFACLGLMFYPSQYALIVGIQLVGVIYIIAALLGKYAFYPTEINIIQGFCIGAGVLFPPFMLLILPVFYAKAKSNLSNFL